MPDYRRWYVPGGTYFFTVVTYQQAPIFRNPHAVELLGSILRESRVKWSVTTMAMVLLDDHLHCVWVLPPADSDYSSRWRWIKTQFSIRWVASGGYEPLRSMSRLTQGERGIWQRRFWEHVVRDEEDLERCCDYIHYNPVKHGYVSRPVDWPASSFQRYVKAGHYAHDWGRSAPPTLPFFGHPE